MSKPDYGQIAKIVDQIMNEKRISNQDLAFQAKVDADTVRRLRRGERVRDHSLKSIEDALGINADTYLGSSPSSAMAPAALGGYPLANYRNYIGTYYMFRHSYDIENRVICCLFEIRWDDDTGCLVWNEIQENVDQRGKVHTPRFSGQVILPAGLSIVQFIYTNDSGLNRIITTSSLLGSAPEYFIGVLLGINQRSGGYRPAASPVYIEKAKWDEEPGKIGSFEAEEIWNRDSQVKLKEALKEYFPFL